MTVNRTPALAAPLALAALAFLMTAAAAGAGEIGYSVQSDATGRAGDHLFRIDLSTGDATDLGATGFEDVESLALAPGCGTLYAVDDVSDRLLVCDKERGACKVVGGLGVDVTDTGLTFSDNGILYMSTDAPKDPARLYRLDPATGRATAVGSQGQEVTGLGGTFSRPSCRSGLFGLGGDGRNNLVCLDPATGEARRIGPLRNVSLNDGGLDFGSDDALYGLADAPRQSTRVITFDLETGAATAIATVRIGGREAGGFEGLAIEGGACSPDRPPSAARMVDAPALGGWGLAALAAALAAVGLAALRRTF
jgi:hypothetical protein